MHRERSPIRLDGIREGLAVLVAAVG
ncbi:MAG: hypothetical protein H6R23_2190, partial [Proteobacteria bacterium]|nr:hypothetical protein [Pseudomonadota bacterium]